MKEEKSVLILGATGGIGGEVAQQLRIAGWRVTALRRGEVNAHVRDGISWIPGDAMSRSDVMKAAKGKTAIIHAVNPPGYKHWGDLVLPMLDNTIATAQAEGATIVLPGTVYNFGPESFPVIDETSPQEPLTRKGRIRVEMEKRLQRSTEDGARVLIVRAGDFFGPKSGNNWFSQALVKPGRPVTKINYPGMLGVGHQWSYLPDVAHTVVELLNQREKLDIFSRFHMSGHWDYDGKQFVEAIVRVVIKRTGRSPTIRRFPWWLLRLCAPFNQTFHEMNEMRYLWCTPIRMRNERLVAALGHEPHTPLDDAIEATLAGLNCLPR